MNSNAGRDLVQEERCWPKNKSLDLWLRPWSLRNLDRLGPCNSEPFKRSKAASHRYFLKYFSRQYSQENTSVEFFFICKVAGLWNYSRADFWLNTSGDFFWQSYLTVLPQLGCLFFDFAPVRAFNFDQKLPQYFAQIILYCHVTIRFLPLLELIYHVISEYILEKYYLLLILMKTCNFDEKLTQSIIQVVNM